MPLDPQTLLAETVALGKKIGQHWRRSKRTQQQASGADQTQQEAQQQQKKALAELHKPRTRLCKVCEHLLLHHPAESAEKDVSKLLFHYGWHKFIADYRARLSVLQTPPADPSSGAARALCGELLGFLAKGQAFYQKIFESLKRRIMADAEPSVQQLHRGTLHRACIVLGDLARYVEMYQDTGTPLGSHIMWSHTLHATRITYYVVAHSSSAGDVGGTCFPNVLGEKV